MADEARLAVKLQPGASVDRIEGWETDPDGQAVLKVRVRARPVDGEANAALIALIARTLDLPKRSVALSRGGRSRLKMIAVEGLSEAVLGDRIKATIRG